VSRKLGKLPKIAEDIDEQLKLMEKQFTSVEEKQREARSSFQELELANNQLIQDKERLSKSEEELKQENAELKQENIGVTSAIVEGYEEGLNNQGIRSFLWSRCNCLKIKMRVEKTLIANYFAW